MDTRRIYLWTPRNSAFFSRHSIQDAQAKTPPKTEKALTTKTRNIISFVDMFVSLW